MKKILLLSVLTISFLAGKSQELKQLPSDTVSAVIYLSTDRTISGYIVKQKFSFGDKIIYNSRLIYLNEKKRVIPTVVSYQPGDSETEFFSSQAKPLAECP